MNNTSITKFNWSQKTNTILNKLGIFTIADFEGVSLKALKDMNVSEKTIKQIEDICKVHNIKTKEQQLALYTVEFKYEVDIKFPNNNIQTCTFRKIGKYIAYDINYVKDDVSKYCEEKYYELKEFIVRDISPISNAYLLDDYKYCGCVDDYK